MNWMNIEDTGKRVFFFFMLLLTSGKFFVVQTEIQTYRKFPAA